MSSLILPRRFTSQPQGPVEVDWSNPLCNGLYLSHVNPNAWPAVNPLPVGADQYLHTKFASSTSVITFPGLTVQQTTEMTVVMLLRRNGTQPDSGFGTSLYFPKVSGIADPFVHFVKTTGERLRLNTATDDDTVNFWETTVDFPLGKWTQSAFVYKTGEVPKIYRDGDLLTLSSSAGPLSGTIKPSLTAQFNLSGLRLNGDMAFAYVWSRGLSDDEIKSVSANPWQLFRAPKRVLYFSTASGTTAVTSDLADDYTIRASASSDLADSYAIRSAIAADLADSYSVQSAVLADLADSYAITASIAAELADSYLIRASVASDLADSYAISAAVSADLADSYDIQTSGVVTSDLSDSYVIRAAVASELADSYAVRAATSSDLADSYAIRSSVVSDLLDGYAIIVSASSDLADSYLVRAAVSADLVDGYSIGEVAVSCPSAADIAEAVWSHASGSDIAVKLSEAWGRLGLDPANPLISGQTEISFGAIVMALTGNSTSSTLTRQ